MTGRELVVPDDIDGALVGLEATVEAARAYAESADAPGTRRVYGTAWRQFIRWCGQLGLDSLPATGTALALWLSDLAKAGIKPKTLHVKAAAVRWAHMSARDPDGKPLPNPTDTPEVSLVMRGILRDAATRGIAVSRPTRSPPSCSACWSTRSTGRAPSADAETRRSSCSASAPR